MRKLAVLLAAAVVLGMMTVASADVVYTYQTSTQNPLEGGTPARPQDYLTISFTIPFALSPNSAYDISVGQGLNVISSWSANDQLFGQQLSGANAPIVLVPLPGHIDGASLTACGNATCFGGTLITGQNGNILRWNLVADSAPNSPFMTFITFNNIASNGVGDIFVFALNGTNVGAANINDGPAGSWQISGAPSSEYVSAVPEPSTWTMMILGFVSLVFAASSRKIQTAQNGNDFVALTPRSLIF